MFLSERSKVPQIEDAVKLPLELVGYIENGISLLLIFNDPNQNIEEYWLLNFWHYIS